MKHVKLYESFINESNEAKIKSLKRDIEYYGDLVKADRKRYKNSSGGEAEMDYSNLSFNLKKLNQAKRELKKLGGSLKESENPSEELALKALYNGIMNDGSIQRFTMQWEDVIKLIKKKYKTIPKDSEIQFQNSLITDALEAITDEKMKKSLKTFARELQMNIDTYNEKSNPAKR